MKNLESLVEKVKHILVSDSSSETPVIYAKKKPPGTNGTATKLVANCYLIDILPNISFFKYDFNITMQVNTRRGELKDVSLIRHHRNDVFEKVRAFRVFDWLVKNNREYFASDKYAVLYDRAAIMFSTRKMEQRTFEIEPINFPAGIPQDALRLVVNVSPCAVSFQASSNDIKLVARRNPNEEKREPLEFLQLLMFNEAFKQPTEFITVGRTHYLYNPGMHGYGAADLPAIAESQYFGVGYSTTVYVKEGFDINKPQAMVVCDVKKNAFHYDDQLLYKKVLSLVAGLSNGRMDASQEAKVTRALKGLSVETIHLAQKQKFNFSSLGRSANTFIIEMADGSRPTAAEYYFTRHGITLEYPNLPMVRAPRGNYYPIEVLNVVSSQVVTNEQMSSKTQQTIITLNAVVPHLRKAQITRLAPAVGIKADNATFKSAGVTVSTELLKLPGRVLPEPNILFAGNKREQLQNWYRWQSGKFFAPGTIGGKWAVVSLLTPRDQQHCNIDAYVKALVGRMTDKGIKFGTPLVLKQNLLTEEYVESVFVMAKEKGASFLFFIESDDSHLHDFIKRMELTYQILTQTVTSSKAARVQRDTLTNVVHKITMKSGGLCYAVDSSNANASKWLTRNETMIIGLEFSHAPPQNASVLNPADNRMMVSTLGYGSNCSNHAQKFLGDYIYVAARDNAAIVGVLTTLIEKLCKQFMVARKVAPKNIVVYFNGISEGQWPLIAGKFLNSIRVGSKKAGLPVDPLFTLIAVSKTHEIRIFKEQTGTGRAIEQNVIPGTVVDTVIVNPAVTEFFLNSHAAIQGSACTPKYSILVDESGAHLDMIENVTHGLCCLHEIISATVSTPAPMMIADRCAERGHKNYVDANRRRHGDPMDVDEANAKLTNAAGGPITRTRYNA